MKIKNVVPVWTDRIDQSLYPDWRHDTFMRNSLYMAQPESFLDEFQMALTVCPAVNPCISELVSLAGFPWHAVSFPKM